jgi:hypothetical protein
VELEVTKAGDARLSLMIVIAPTALLIGAIANRGPFSQALISAAVGGGVCWTAGALALTATYLGNRFQAPVQGLLGGMVFRMGLPLAAILALPQLGGPVAASSVTTTILGVYLVALLGETLLALRMVPPQASTVRAT